MIATAYHDVILAGWVTALVLGVCLLFCRVPSTPGYTTYLRSRRILGVAYLIFAAGIAQFSFFDLRHTAPSVAIALPLSYYYLEGILFGMSFCSLLDKGYISRRQIYRDFGFYLLFLILVWGGALFASGFLQKGLLVVSAMWFVVAASGITLRFLKIYNRAVNQINGYYADDVAAFVRWLHKSTYGIIFFGLCGSFLSFAPPWGNTIFMLCGIAMFTYIYISLQNYILNYEYVETVVVTEAESENAAPIADDTDLGKAIRGWVESGAYREAGITLDKIATAVESNRSYVSAFINSEYHCNFREWINSLRIDYAKTLLTASDALTIERIATDSGFSTSAYFCRQFSRREGMTPSKWREEAKNGVKTNQKLS